MNAVKDTEYQTPNKDLSATVWLKPTRAGEGLI